MSFRTLAVSKSTLAKGSDARAAKLLQLDKNGDGQLDIDEVCDAIDEIICKEKTERTLKWLLAALAIFSLLIIAATVGLTYAVVVMSKDTQVNGALLQSKDSGKTLRTGSYLQSQDAGGLAAALDAIDSTPDVGQDLALLSAIKIPGSAQGEVFTVYKVASATLMENDTVRIATVGGQIFDMAMDELTEAAALAATDPAATPVQPTQRRLLASTAGTFTVTVVQGTKKYVIAGLKPSTKLGELKRRVQAKGGPPAGTQRLKFMFGEFSDELSDNSAPLEGYGVTDGFALEMVVVEVSVSRGCAERGVVCAQALVSVYVPPDATVATLKREIRATKGLRVPVKEQVLTVSGGAAPLEDEATLEDCGISEDGSVVNLQPSVRLYS